MVINSLNFLLFFVLVFSLYYIPKRDKNIQNTILFIANYAFYAFANWCMCLFLLIMNIATYWMGIKIEKSKNNIYVVLSILIGLTPLIYYKYYHFFLESIYDIFHLIGVHMHESTVKIALPLGISFFTFKIISYFIEIHKSNIKAEKNFIILSNYISFFPTIISGPIDRPNSFISQLLVIRKFNYELAVDGCRQILWGLFKKMVIADNIANIVNEVWNDYTNLPASTLIWTACLYSIQIYTDFSGYSDMAIGVGKLLGFNIIKNFNMPYFSRNMNEFWKKWHVSLTSWFTDYIYKPLGGNRCSKIRHLINILIVFLVSGLWHGANWTFVLWGAFHGLLLIISILMKQEKYKEIIAKDKNLPKFTEIVLMLKVFMLSTIGWILFRATTISDGFLYLKRIFTTTWLIRPDIHINILSYIFILFVLEWITRDKEHPLQLKSNKFISYSLYLFLTYLIIYHQGQSSDFIYFKF